jgi:HD-GYP domain-containing protein (c-di-GMP phosphodiesterase class II)
MSAAISLTTPLMKALKPAIDALARAHRHRDPHMSLHQERVAKCAAAIATLMKMPASRIEVLYLAALVHDIGKLGVPYDLVIKPGKLSEPEFLLMQMHCEIGHDILLQLKAPSPVAEVAYQHHERMDGSGYPRRLRGSAILLEARILAVADTFDAMSSYRPYRGPLAEDFVVSELRRRAGVSLDGDAVEACVRHMLGGAGIRPAAGSIVEPQFEQES